jgi:hypothetical protein
MDEIFPRKGENMPVWIPLGIVLLEVLGGVINAIISDNGFVVPREETIDNVCIVRPGVAGNVLLGAVAAFISWGLFRWFYRGRIEELNLSLSALVGAVLIGIGEAIADQRGGQEPPRDCRSNCYCLRPSSEQSRRMVVATPAQAFNIAKGMY